MSFIVKLWKKDNWFKAAIILTIFVLGASLFLEYGIGADGNNLGTVLLEENQITLNRNSTIVYTVTFESVYCAYAMASNQKVDLYIIGEKITGNPNMSYIKANSLVHKTTDQFTYWFDHVGDFSVVVVTPANQNIVYSDTFRDFTSNDMQKIMYYTLGSYLLYLTVAPLGLFIVFRIILPWYKKRKTNNPDKI